MAMAILRAATALLVNALLFAQETSVTKGKMSAEA